MSANKDSKAISSSSIDDEWVKYWEHPIAGEGNFSLSEEYAILIVMNGKIELTFKRYIIKTVTEKSLVVIARQKLTNVNWEANTAILIYTPPTKIFRFFGSCSSVFNMPCSPIVPMRQKLLKWVDDLMAERLQPKEMLTDILRRKYCVRLGNILRGYPPLLVGELLIPFHACSLSGEKRCNGENCE